eukprot:14654645-Ditylum_brightwellii.AAC.1
MPSHSIMTHDHFNFIWQHFHVQPNTEYYQADIHKSDNDIKEDDDNNELYEQTLEKVQRDEEDMHGDDCSANMSDFDEDKASCNNHVVEDSSKHPRKKDI